MDRLRTALAEAKNTGWATGSAEFDDLLREGHWYLDWTIHTTRGKTDHVDELRPTSTTEAHPASLSATHGTGQQPLHTDGAHVLKPAQWLLFGSTDVSSVPTLFWPYDSAEIDVPVGDAIREGLFIVVSGSTNFLAPVHSGSMLRFDPGCMRPADSRAMLATEFLSTRTEQAVEHRWDEHHGFLLLDNHRCLHARGDATSELDRVLRRISFDLPKKAAR